MRQGGLPCGSPSRPAPLPRDEMLGSGPGARVHTHTHTHHTHTYTHHTLEAGTRLLSHIHTQHTCTHPMCTQMHKDTNSTHSPRTHTHTHAHESAHSTDTFTLRLQNVGLGEVGGLRPPSQRPPPQYVPETPLPAPSSTKFMGPNTVSVRDV